MGVTEAVMEETEGGGRAPGSARAASCPELLQKPPPWSSSPSPSVCPAQQQTRKSRSDPPLQRTYRGIPHSSVFSESPPPLNKGTYKVLQLQPNPSLCHCFPLCSPHRWSRQTSLLMVLFTYPPHCPAPRPVLWNGCQFLGSRSYPFFRRHI